MGGMSMTREDEIKYASKDYVNYLLDKQEYHNENYTEYDIQQAFEKGAKWADSNPKSSWISVKDDLPCNHEELVNAQDKSTKKVIVVDKYDGVIVDFMRSVNRVWYWRHAVEALYWAFIPNLPKE